MTLFGIRIKVHLLSPLILLLLFVFSGASEVWVMLFSLCVHEFGHLAAAFLLKAKIDELELMPYGAAIRLYGLWELHPVKLFLISLAGPASNFLIACMLSLAMRLFPSLGISLYGAMLSGLMLAAINLIPALPLDGGRCLCALLSLKLSRPRAVSIGMFAGKVFSLILFILFLQALFISGKVNLMPLISSVYIYASQRQEKAQSEGAYLRSRILKKTNPVARRASVLIVRESDTPFSAAKLLHPGECAVIAVTDTNGRILRVFSDEEVLRSLLHNANEPFQSFL